MYLMRGPRQLFFQCDPETPKGWTPLKVFKYFSWLEHHPDMPRLWGGSPVSAHTTSNQCVQK